MMNHRYKVTTHELWQEVLKQDIEAEQGEGKERDDGQIPHEPFPPGYNSATWFWHRRNPLTLEGPGREVGVKSCAGLGRLPSRAFL